MRLNRRLFTPNPLASGEYPRSCFDDGRVNRARAVRWLCPELTDDEARLIAGAAHNMPLSRQTVEQYIRLLGIGKETR